MTSDPKKISFKKFKAPPLGKVPVNILIPNFLTLIALCSGFSAVQFALLENWEFAAISIFIAALFDGLDGRIARLIGGASRFGAELDSLSDFVSFGVAPSLVIYFYSLNQLGKWGWIGALFFTVACALRLARFNTLSIEGDTKKTFSPVWATKFFLGVPVPAGAAIALLPLLIELETEFSIHLSPFIYLIILIISGLLMISHIHTYAFKSLHLHRRLILPSFVGIGLLVAGFITNPWLTLIIAGILYLISIPFSDLEYRNLLKKSQN
ncbi:MAG: phosphatidylcholine/phosphatidylserine synthase [Proteobacteria bacterium]|nr:phosphatidylcholine/phosphatidylserine synthase [Pseudomonadota bacterium]